MKLLILTISWRKDIGSYYKNAILYKSLVKRKVINDSCQFMNVHVRTDDFEIRPILHTFKQLLNTTVSRYPNSRLSPRWPSTFFKIYHAAHIIDQIGSNYTHILYIDLDDTCLLRSIDLEDFNVDKLVFGWDVSSHWFREIVQKWGSSNSFDHGRLSAGFMLGPVYLFKEMMGVMARPESLDLPCVAYNGNLGDEALYNYFYLNLSANIPCCLDTDSFWVLNTFYRRKNDFYLNHDGQIENKKTKIRPYFIHQTHRHSTYYNDFLRHFYGVRFPKDPSTV